MSELRTLDELEKMSAEAFDVTHPLAPKLITLLKSARGYRKALMKVEHLRNHRGERWAVATGRYYETMLHKAEDEIDGILHELDAGG